MGRFSYEDDLAFLENVDVVGDPDRPFDVLLDEEERPPLGLEDGPCLENLVDHDRRLGEEHTPINLEDVRAQHTRNPALCIVAGAGPAQVAEKLGSLSDVAGMVLARLGVVRDP